MGFHPQKMPEVGFDPLSRVRGFVVQGNFRPSFFQLTDSPHLLTVDFFSNYSSRTWVKSILRSDPIDNSNQ